MSVHIIRVNSGKLLSNLGVGFAPDCARRAAAPFLSPSFSLQADSMSMLCCWCEPQPEPSAGYEHTMDLKGADDKERAIIGAQTALWLEELQENGTLNPDAELALEDGNFQCHPLPALAWEEGAVDFPEIIEHDSTKRR